MADQHLAQNAKQSDDTARIRREETLPEQEEEVVQSTVQRAAQALAAPADAEPDDVAALQQVAGNRAVSQLIASQAAEDDGVVQAKLMVGAPGDKFEREADQVAAKVMNADVTSSVSQPATEGAIQRQDKEDEFGDGLDIEFRSGYLQDFQSEYSGGKDSEKPKPKFGRSNTFSFSGQTGPKQTRLLNNYVTSKTGKQEKSNTRSKSKFHRTETLGAVFQTADSKKQPQPAPQSDNKPVTKTNEDTQKPNKKAQGKLPPLDKKQLSAEAQKLATPKKGNSLPGKSGDDEKNQAFAEMEQQEAEQQLDQEQQETLGDEQQEQVDTGEEQQEQADTDEEQQVDEDAGDAELDIDDMQNLMGDKEELDQLEQSAEASQEEALDEEALEEEEVEESEIEEEEDEFDAEDEEEQTWDEVTAEENEPDWALSALLEDLEPIGGKPYVQRLTNDVSEYEEKTDPQTKEVTKVVKEVVDVEKKDLSDTLSNASKKRAATARVARVEPGIPGLKGVSEDIWLKPLDGLISAQRQTEETGQAQTELAIQRQPATDGSFEVEDKVEQRLMQEKSKGRSLPDDVRTDMESRFGADFSNVRVHTGSEAAQLSENLNAQAFTHGNDIFFNAGKGNFDTADNKRLLAHELTHVIQQMGYGKKDDSSNG